MSKGKLLKYAEAKAIVVGRKLVSKCSYQEVVVENYSEVVVGAIV